MVKKITSFILFYSLLAGTTVFAQADTLDWPTVLSRAREKNPDYLSAKKSFEGALASYKASWNGVFPNLSLSTGYSDSDSANKNNRWDATATARMDVFNASNLAKIRTASANMRQLQARYNQQSAELRLNLKSAFATLSSSQDLLAVTDHIRKIREENAQTVSLKYDSGRESKGNKLRVEAELAQAMADQRKARRNLRVSLQQLNRQLGEPEFTVTIVTGTITTNLLPPAPEISTLKENHPRLQELRVALDIAEASLSDARSSAWPKLSASYSRTVYGPSFFPDESHHWLFSSLLSVPLFSGGPTFTYYSSKAAHQSLEKAQQDYFSGELLLRTQLETSWANLANALDAVQVQSQFLLAARQRNDEGQVRYSMGYISFDDWERIVEDLVNSEKAVIQSNQDALIAEANWERALAKSVEEP